MRGHGALALHDAHLDLTRERTFTPSAQAEAVVRSLTQDVQLTYFYHAADQNGRRAKALVEILGRQHPHLHVRTVDPDKQPRLTETYGIRLYNAAILEADGPPDATAAWEHGPGYAVQTKDG